MLGSQDEFLLFTVVNSFQRLTESVVFACFYLDKNYFLPQPGNDIYFSVSAVIIFGQNGVAAVQEISLGKFFALFA